MYICSLFPTPEASKLLQVVLDLLNAESSEKTQSAGPSGSSTSAETHPSAAGAKHRHANSKADAPSSSFSSMPNGNTKESEKRDYTPDQEAIVKRIRSCEVTEYYEIMTLKRDCTETDVKKAYRKVHLRRLLLRSPPSLTCLSARLAAAS